MRSTVFLTTAGQHVTIGSSDTAELIDVTLIPLQARGQFAMATPEIAQGRAAQAQS